MPETYVWGTLKKFKKKPEKACQTVPKIVTLTQVPEWCFLNEERILKMFEIEYRPYKSEGQNNWKGEVKTYRVKIVDHYGSEAEGSNIGYVGINEDGQIRRFNYHQIINMSHVGR